MRYTSFILLMGLMACQSTRLPDAKILRDPSPQLVYRYVNPEKSFSFDFPYYGLRFFKTYIDSCNSLIIKDLKPEKAVDYISRHLPNQRLVMLNEAHHLPICRLFAIQLLDSLKKNGFHYLALETLAHDHKVNKNGFPTTDDGFYLVEPMFAELIRQAVLKGFKIIDYDDNRDSVECLPPPDAHRFYCNNLRETNAAARIVHVFKQDAKAKVFVFVGHSHKITKAHFFIQKCTT